MEDILRVRIASDGTGTGTTLYDAATGDKIEDVAEIRFRRLTPDTLLRGRLFRYTSSTSDDVYACEAEFVIGDLPLG